MFTMYTASTRIIRMFIIYRIETHRIHTQTRINTVSQYILYFMLCVVVQIILL